MRKRHRAAVFAIAVSAAGLLPAAAHADSSATIYVNDSGGSSCNDSGPGTQAEPFCNLQPAVDATVPGDTVLIAAGQYAPVTITKSGTAAAPITIKGTAALGSFVVIADSASPTQATALAFSGVSYVTVSNLNTEGVARYATLTDSSHVTLDSLSAMPTYDSIDRKSVV